jgi:hypothetical protein
MHIRLFIYAQREGTSESKSNIHTKQSLDILTGTDHLEDLSEDGRVIFKLQLREMGYEATERLKLAPNRLQWQALINRCSTEGGELSS